jgi:hypothetical protein
VVSLSSRGMPIPYFRPPKSVAVNTEVYINEFLQPRLLPFKIYENLPFVNNTTHPLNVPQARQIENLRGILAQKVYEGGWEAKTKQELISRIQSQLKKFD